MIERFANQAITSLIADLAASTTTATVVSTELFPINGQFRIAIDSEIIIATVASATTFSLTRGAEGTTAAQHKKGADVVHVLTAGAFSRMVRDVLTNATASAMRERRAVKEAEAQLLYDTFGSWTPTYTGTATGNLAYADGYKGAASCARFTTDGANGQIYIDSPTLSTPVDMSGKLVKVAFKLEDHARLYNGGAHLTLYLGNGGEFTNYVSFRLEESATATSQWYISPDNQWVEVTFPWTPNATGGTFDRTSVNKIRIRVTDNNDGRSSWVEVGRVAIVADAGSRLGGGGASATGGVVITFDDNLTSQYSLAFPAMRDRGIAGTVYIIDDTIGTAGRATEAQIDEMVAHGWDAAIHAFAAATHNARMTCVPSDALEADLDAAIAFHRARGWNASHLAYPHGAFAVPAITRADITFANGSPATITRASGSFTTDGFVAGMDVLVSGSANPANNGTFRVASVSALTLTLDASATLTAESAGATIMLSAATDVIGAVSTRFKTARTILGHKTLLENYPPTNGARVRAYTVANTTLLSDLQAAALNARNNRALAIFVFHDLVTGAASQGTQYTIANFTALLDYCLSMGIPFWTMGRLFPEPTW